MIWFHSILVLSSLLVLGETILASSDARSRDRYYPNSGYQQFKDQLSDIVERKAINLGNLLHAVSSRQQTNPVCWQPSKQLNRRMKMAIAEGLSNYYEDVVSALTDEAMDQEKHG